jgi:hypothetical protein
MAVLAFYQLYARPLHNELMLWNQHDYGYRADHVPRIDEVCY